MLIIIIIIAHCRTDDMVNPLMMNERNYIADKNKEISGQQISCVHVLRWRKLWLIFWLGVKLKMCGIKFQSIDKMSKKDFCLYIN